MLRLLDSPIRLELPVGVMHRSVETWISLIKLECWGYQVVNVDDQLSCFDAIYGS